MIKYIDIKHTMMNYDLYCVERRGGHQELPRRLTTFSYNKFLHAVP